jgi:hypothetical protein
VMITLSSIDRRCAPINGALTAPPQLKPKTQPTAAADPAATIELRVSTIVTT